MKDTARRASLEEEEEEEEEEERFCLKIMTAKGSIVSPPPLAPLHLIPLEGVIIPVVFGANFIVSSPTLLSFPTSHPLPCIPFPSSSNHPTHTIFFPLKQYYTTLSIPSLLRAFHKIAYFPLSFSNSHLYIPL